MAPVDLSALKIKVPKESFATNYIFTYNTIMNSPILWQMTFTTNTQISQGIPQIGGKSYMLVYFPTVVNGINCFANDFGSGKANFAKMDSFNIANMPSIEVYLIYGVQSSGTPGLFYIRNYGSALSTGTTFEFYLP